MHIHILGISGTFMAGIAVLARAAGHRVTGSDTGTYPPMSTQLADHGIDVLEGYDSAHLDPAPDLVVVGNVMSRGMPVVEYVLDQRIPYVSGPGWLSRFLLGNRRVLAVAGTHGKTTTSSMLAWILEATGHAPGFLIGGMPGNFGVSARFGEEPFFVIEADEYDTAFFDKRSKFVHYRPEILAITNLEFDHADIFDDMAAIRWQFHQLMRTVPGNGRIVRNASAPEIDHVVEMGCWTPIETFAVDTPAGWQAGITDARGSEFNVTASDRVVGKVSWPLRGQHNVENALAAIAAASAVGVAPGEACAALNEFEGVARRLEPVATAGGVEILDDFAHHPTAISSTLAALGGSGRIVAVFEPRSRTMKRGVHGDALARAFAGAEAVWVYRPPDIEFDLGATMRAAPCPVEIRDDIDTLIADLSRSLVPGDRVVVMSNGGFGGLPRRLAHALDAGGT